MTNCAGRFTDCGSDEFPEVSNYDYENNLGTRGSENRSFRWEEPTVASVYLFQEATVSGSFEENLFLQHNGLSGSATLISGVYITTGTQPNQTGYPGWTVTGSDTVYIGQSGISVISGHFTGLTGSFTAFPLNGNEAIGFYVRPGGVSNPKIISSLLATGEGGIVDGQNHQVYLQARSNYVSGSASIKAYVRGYESSAIVAYYDHISGLWQAGVPTGEFQVSTSGYTEIKYKFNASDFPAATPTEYDLVVESFSTGSFITVDDIHVDSILKRNAFVDYILPTGYMIQITPDLGWHDVNSMFDTNPHLRSIGPYAIELGNLSDNLDNSVIATVDAQDFDLVTHSSYSKYLWRAIAISPNGSLGRKGFPRKFQYIGEILNKEFSIDEYVDDNLSVIKNITGRRGHKMTILVDGLPNHPGLSYPTKTTWALAITMTSISQTISIQAKDEGGATSSIQYITLSNKMFNQNYKAVWNVFDEHGLVEDIQRLPNESNADYTERILDSTRNRGGNTFLGIANSSVREVGLKQVPNGITLSLRSNILGQPLTSALDLEVTSYSIRVRAANMVLEETLLVDPIYGTVDLSKFPKELPESVITEEGVVIPLHKIYWSSENEENPTIYRLAIDSASAIGRYIRIRYQYFEELLFKTYPDLGSITSALNALLDVRGQRYIDVTFSDLLSGNEDCLGLFLTVQTVTDTISIPWSPIYLKKIADRGFRNYYLGVGQTHRDTHFYKYVKELKTNTRIFWGHVEADRDYWDSADSQSLSLDSIPTLFDPPITNFYSLQSGILRKIEPISAWGKEYLGYSGEVMFNIGIHNKMFHPGVAYTNDLMPDIYVTTSSDPNTEGDPGNVSSQKNNNHSVFFSGQR